MVVSSFANKKLLKFVVTLADGKSYSSSPGVVAANTVTWLGYKSIADISNAGGFEAAQLKAKIYGVSQSDMLAVTTLSWTENSYVGNMISVFAVDGNQETLVFSGAIVNAWPNFSEVPNVFLDILAVQLYTNAQETAPARNFPGSTDVASIVKIIADSMGLGFTNTENVTINITDEYLRGSNRDQLYKIVKDAGLGLFLQPNTIAITASPTTPLKSTSVPIINKSTGLIGWPSIEIFGVNFATLYNPQITFGGRIKLESEVPQTTGEWFVCNLHHTLNSVNPQPDWKSTVRGYIQGVGLPE